MAGFLGFEPKSRSFGGLNVAVTPKSYISTNSFGALFKNKSNIFNQQYPTFSLIQQLFLHLL